MFAALDAKEEPRQDIGLAIFELHERRLFRLARRLSSSHDDAADLVQETFVRALRSSASLPENEREQESWLVTVLVNLARDRSRRNLVRVPATIEPVSDPGGPETQYVARIAVEKALARLDARRRAVVVMHELDGEPVARIAELLGIMPVTVRWHLARAKKELGALLGCGESQ